MKYLIIQSLPNHTQSSSNYHPNIIQLYATLSNYHHPIIVQLSNYYPIIIQLLSNYYPIMIIQLSFQAWSKCLPGSLERWLQSICRNRVTAWPANSWAPAGGTQHPHGAVVANKAIGMEVQPTMEGSWRYNDV